MQMQEIKLEEIEPTIRKIFAAGGDFTFYPKGTSMHPIVPDNARSAADKTNSKQRYRSVFIFMKKIILKKSANMKEKAGCITLVIRKM